MLLSENDCNVSGLSSFFPLFKEVAMEKRRLERMDDIPERMVVAKIIDSELPRPHANRQGLSYGQLSVLFLCYVIYSRTQHLSPMEGWTGAHRRVLEQSMKWAAWAIKRRLMIALKILWPLWEAPLA
jgi:hypothetical protein